MKPLYRLLFTTLFILQISLVFGQKDSIQTIENQFDYIYRISSTYQNYKVINRDRFKVLKNNVLDSLRTSSMSIASKDKIIASKTKEIESLKKDLAETNSKLKTAISKENSFSFFGMEVNKGTYNLIVWLLVGILLATLIYFIYQYSKSNVITKTAIQDLEEVEQEFESHRKKTLEREQKLRRQLHDEINKNRNN